MQQRGRKFLHILTGPIGMILLALIVLTVLILLMVSAGETSVKALPAIRQRGAIYIGVRSDLEPFGKLQADGSIKGLEAELALLLGKEVLGDDAVILVPVTNKTRRARLDYEEVDFLVSMVADSAANRKLFKMSRPYYSDPISLASIEGKGIDLQADATYNIGVASGSIAQNALEEYKKNATIKTVNISGYEDAAQKLKRGEIDAICAENSFLLKVIEQDSTIAVTSDAIGQIHYAVCSRKAERDLAKEIEKAFTTIIEDGRLNELYQQYGVALPVIE